MTAQSISSDLTTYSTMEAGTSATDIGGGQGSSDETDFYIQGSACQSRKVSGNGTLAGVGFTTAGTALGTVTDDHAYVWVNCLTPGLINTTANGGIRIYLGDSPTVYKSYYVNGNEDLIGGWKCYPVSPNGSADDSNGIIGGFFLEFIGAALLTTGTINRNNIGVDAIRFGTGIDASGGGSPDPDLDYASISTFDADTTRQLGILQPTPSGVELQGRLRLGIDDTTSPTVFSETNGVLTKPNNNPVTQNTLSTFSGIVLRGSQTNATFTSCLFLSLDTTDQGFIDCDTATNGATASFDKCTFIDWGTISGRSTVSFDGCSFNGCQSLTTNGSSVDNCSFDTCQPVECGNNLSDITNCSFTQGGQVGPAIATSVNSGTISFVGNTFSGYSLVDQDPSSAIFFDATSGSVTVNVSGAAIPTYNTLGVTVNFQLSNTLELTGLEAGTEVRVYDAGTTTELAGIESTSGTFSTSVAVSAVDIVIFNLNFIAIRLTNVDTTSDRTIPIQQQEDRQYENP